MTDDACPYDVKRCRAAFRRAMRAAAYARAVARAERAANIRWGLLVGGGPEPPRPAARYRVNRKPPTDDDPGFENVVRAMEDG